MAGLNDFVDVFNFIKYSEDGIFTDEKLDFLEQMLGKNKNALKYMNFGLLKDNVFNSLNKDFIEYLTKFSNLSNEVIMIAENNPKLFSVFASRVNGYETIKDNFSEIECMINGFAGECLNIELNDINELTCDNLINYFEQSNNFKQSYKINAIFSDFPQNYTENYVQNIRAYLDKKYGEFTERYQKQSERGNAFVKEFFSNKVEVYCNKYFSMSLKNATKLLQEYGKDLDNIEGIAREKQFFNHLRSFIENEFVENLLKTENNKDVSDLTSLYDGYWGKAVHCIDELFYGNNIAYDCVTISKIKNTIAKECAKTYADSLVETQNKIQNIQANKNDLDYKQMHIEGQNIDVIRLKGKFDMFLHSTDTGFVFKKSFETEPNFKEMWDNQADKTDHVLSTVYINQNFMGMPPLKDSGVMYAFLKLPREHIRLMGVTDINTYNRQFAYDSKTKQYMTAKTMPNSSRRVYSEFALEKQYPDYVILTDDANKNVINNTIQCAKQFNIPILYIDKSEIVREQIDNLNQKLKQFNDTKDIDLLMRILNQYETNVAGWLLNRVKDEDVSNTKGIDNSRFLDDFNNVQKDIEQALVKYLNDFDQNHNADTESLLKVAITLLKEKELYENSLSGGNELKISATTMKLDYDVLVENLNSALERCHLKQYQITEKTNLNGYIKMHDIIKNAVMSDGVSLQDVKDSLAVEKSLRAAQERSFNE